MNVSDSLFVYLRHTQEARLARWVARWASPHLCQLLPMRPGLCGLPIPTTGSSAQCSRVDIL